MRTHNEIKNDVEKRMESSKTAIHQIAHACMIQMEILLDIRGLLEKQKREITGKPMKKKP